MMRVVRMRMRLHGKSDEIRHDVGSSDVCQSVFRSLFRGVEKESISARSTRDLERLLQVMIRFNVATKARRSSVKLRELIDDFEQGGWMDSGSRPGPGSRRAGPDRSHSGTVLGGGTGDPHALARRYAVGGHRPEARMLGRRGAGAAEQGPSHESGSRLNREDHVRSLSHPRGRTRP